ncbi:hypothetical protein JW960_16965 [candidate division KSB1 bacterium]|nr:hypothetical protein [candidate division KSB1 bacterium]
MIDKKSYLQKSADKLQQWDADIDELKAKAAKAKAESKAEVAHQLDELQAKKENLQHMLKQLQTAGDGAWDDIRTGFERSWTELKGAYEKASAQFK